MIGGSAALVAIGGSLAARMSQMMRHGLAIDPQQPAAITRLDVGLAGRGRRQRAAGAAADIRRA